MFCTDRIQSEISQVLYDQSHVLILGPTGTGKSTLAQEIHERSCPREAQFVSVNLATLAPSLIESELFGHEKGAFTGADSRRKGRLEQAQGGTLFLDEIGELSWTSQARLLDFIQTKRIVPVGAGIPRVLDVRVIAATNCDLRDMVKKRQFREDLYYRLAQHIITLQPLTAWGDEFGELVQDLVSHSALKAGKKILRISEELARLLELHSWPGNIRELQNVLEVAVTSCQSELLDIENIPPWFEPMLQGETALDEGLGLLEIGVSLDYRTTLERMEKAYFHRIFGLCGYRVNEMSRLTKINKTTLIKKLRKYQLSRPALTDSLTGPSAPSLSG